MNYPALSGHRLTLWHSGGPCLSSSYGPAAIAKDPEKYMQLRARSTSVGSRDQKRVNGSPEGKDVSRVGVSAHDSEWQIAGIELEESTAAIRKLAASGRTHGPGGIMAWHLPSRRVPTPRRPTNCRPSAGRLGEFPVQLDLRAWSQRPQTRIDIEVFVLATSARIFIAASSSGCIRHDGDRRWPQEVRKYRKDRGNEENR